MRDGQRDQSDTCVRWSGASESRPYGGAGRNSALRALLHEMHRIATLHASTAIAPAMHATTPTNTPTATTTAPHHTATNLILSIINLMVPFPQTPQAPDRMVRCGPNNAGAFTCYSTPPTGPLDLPLTSPRCEALGLAASCINFAKCGGQSDATSPWVAGVAGGAGGPTF